VATYNWGQNVKVGDVVRLGERRATITRILDVAVGNEARVEVAVQIVARELEQVN
jgi:hypothetical protein